MFWGMPRKGGEVDNLVVETTERGFEIIQFCDRNGEECSLQQSSAWLDNDAAPGASAVWLGRDEAGMRMHLDRSLVAQLIHVLQRWLDIGSFEDDGR